MIKTLGQPLQYLEMGLPIYQIQMCQKAPPKVIYTTITQEIPKSVPATKKY